MEDGFLTDADDSESTVYLDQSIIGQVAEVQCPYYDTVYPTETTYKIPYENVHSWRECGKEKQNLLGF